MQEEAEERRKEERRGKNGREGRRRDKNKVVKSRVGEKKALGKAK